MRTALDHRMTLITQYARSRLYDTSSARYATLGALRARLQRSSPSTPKRARLSPRVLLADSIGCDEDGEA